jgi:hypothetical protein
MPRPPASPASNLPSASAGRVVTEPAKARSILAIVLIACLIAIAGSLISILCTTIAAWLTGSGYVVAPGGRF